MNHNDYSLLKGMGLTHPQIVDVMALMRGMGLSMQVAVKRVLAKGKN